MNKLKKTCLPYLLTAIIIIISVIIFITCSRNIRSNNPSIPIDENVDDWTGNKETNQVTDNVESIKIPGFNSMNLKADSKSQNVNLHNPKENNCYFKLSILLLDGTKLWESNLIEPGKALYKIDLEEPLSAGEYKDSILKYECFSLDSRLTPLNGAEIKLKLNVIN